MECPICAFKYTDKKRNDIIGTPEYMEAVKKQQGQSQSPARQQQAQQTLVQALHRVTLEALLALG